MTFIDEIKKPMLALSPMAGISDSPFRQICKKEKASFSFTEFGSVDHILVGNQKTMAIYQFQKSERPIIFQIFGNDINKIIPACKKLLLLNPDGIDLNLGCSIKRINFKGSGVALMQEPKKVEKILSEMIKQLPVPISAKMRLGYSNQNKNVLEIAKIAESVGCHFVSIHGRTKENNFSQPANWEDIANVKAKVNIPILGNGDITSYNDAIKKINTYHLDGALIGRATLGNPWIFNNQKIDKEKFIQTIEQHLIYHKQYYEKYFINIKTNTKEKKNIEKRTSAGSLLAHNQLEKENIYLTTFRKHLLAYLNYYTNKINNKIIFNDEIKNKLFKNNSIKELIFVLRTATQ